MTQEQIKIAHRFLKEVGLYNQWKRYLNRYTEFNKTYYCEGYREYIYSGGYIDSIFGRCNFTEYLECVEGIKMNYFISDHFRKYVSLKYGLGKFIFACKSYAGRGAYIYNEETGEYKILFTKLQ